MSMGENRCLNMIAKHDHPRWSRVDELAIELLVAWAPCRFAEVVNERRYDSRARVLIGDHQRGSKRVRLAGVAEEDEPILGIDLCKALEVVELHATDLALQVLEVGQ